jgi:hypothetical protein
MDLDLVNLSQASQTQPALEFFAEKPLSFPIFTKIPFHLRGFLAV